MKRWWRREETTPPTFVEPEPPAFVCRTCRSASNLYEAREVVNWNAIGRIYRKPDGGLTYRTYNRYLPGDPGPPLRWGCTNCNTYTESLEELVEGEDEILLTTKAESR